MPLSAYEDRDAFKVYACDCGLLHRIRFSMLNLQFNGGLLSSPAPLASWFEKLIALVK